jgi:hypothetical protein
VYEYNKDDPHYGSMVNYRRRTAFCITGWRDIKEDLDQYDVGALKYIRTPYVTSRSPLRQTRDEFDAFAI